MQVLGPHIAADSGRWVKPQDGRGQGQEEEADLRGPPEGGHLFSSENCLDFPKQRSERTKARGWGVYRMATGCGFSQPALQLCEPDP